MATRRTILLALPVVWVMFVPALSQDSTPQHIQVQGFLSDKSGGSPVPATGTFAMTFDLYDADAGGLLVASGGPLSVEVSEGLYEVDLPFPAAAFDGKERHVEITVDGETLSPRIRVVSAPFAYVAESLDGFEGTDLDQSEDVTALQGADANLQSQIDAVADDLTEHESTTDPHAVYVKKTGDDMTGTLTIDPDSGHALEVRSPALSVPAVRVFGEDPDVLVDITSDGAANLAELKFRLDGIEKGRLAYNKTDDSMHLYNGSNVAVFLTADGNVGIGTGSPAAKLEIRSAGAGKSLLRLGTDRPWEFQQQGSGPGTVLKLTNAVAGSDGAKSFVIETQGNVGIGTTSPQEKLDVNGTTRTKILQITGGADLAEPFDVTRGDTVPAGAVLIIDDTHPGRLKIADEPYDTRVAGVVSGAGGISPGLTLSQDGIADGEVKVALVGRVYALATASNGSIRPGDLLTTSHVPGRAMKVSDMGRAPGAVIGKAMSFLDEGDALILVVVNLQ